MQKQRYKSEVWLREQYMHEEMSTRQIAAKENVDPETIRKNMIKFGIPLRPATNINHTELSDEAIEFLSGDLLGDGSIIWGTEPVSAYYSLTSKYETYLKWIETKLLRFGILKRGNIKSYKNKWGTYWLLQSKYYRGELPEIRTLWYPDGKKIVPTRLHLTPTMVQIWFIGDGSAVTTPTQKRITFATNGFTKNTVIQLKDSLAALIGHKEVYVNKSNMTGYIISMSKKDVIKSFYSLIGECPKEIEDICGYKWKLS